MRDENLAPPRRVWRPQPVTAAAPAEPEPYDGPVFCGGPILTVDERYELMKTKKRELDEERARAAAEAAEQEQKEKEKEKLPGRGDDEDDQRMLERFRNDRYSVKLLRQQNDAWGGPSSDGGALG
jgi:hypothetical protein